MPGRPEQEIELRGGTTNRGLVVRVGDTVRRPQTAASPAVHALLLHLERQGFDGAPRYLGQDEAGREVVSYVEGDVPTAPYPAWALTDDALVSVAELLRRYHRAVESFDPGPHRWPTTVPSPYRSRLVSHNDPNLDNIVFRGGQAVALIDFDLAAPGSALWDVALAARLWVPLRDPVDVPDDRAGRVRERLRLLADAYGLPEPERRLLTAAARETHTWCYDIVRVGAEQGRPGYAQYWTPGVAEYDERGRRWLARNVDLLAGALS
jgi:hypothetical protein